MFRVEELEGKGKGCLANRRIEVGELILREKPALLLKPRNDEEVDSVEGGDVEEEMETLEAFLGMTREQQVEFLELANMYDDNARKREEWPGVTNILKESTLKSDIYNDPAKMWTAYLLT